MCKIPNSRTPYCTVQDLKTISLAVYSEGTKTMIADTVTSTVDFVLQSSMDTTTTSTELEEENEDGKESTTQEETASEYFV